MLEWVKREVDPPAVLRLKFGQRSIGRFGGRKLGRAGHADPPRQARTARRSAGANGGEIGSTRQQPAIRRYQAAQRIRAAG